MQTMPATNWTQRLFTFIALLRIHPRFVDNVLYVVAGFSRTGSRAPRTAWPFAQPSGVHFAIWRVVYCNSGYTSRRVGRARAGQVERVKNRLVRSVRLQPDP